MLNTRTPRTEFLVGQEVQFIAYRKWTGVCAVLFDGEMFARLPAIRVLEYGLRILSTTSLSGNDFGELLRISPSSFAATFPDCWSAIVEKRKQDVHRRMAADRVDPPRGLRPKYALWSTLMLGGIKHVVADLIVANRQRYG
ncbi:MULTISPECIES: hypothetical protein [unclassified Cupriavidus]|uniref:hypothetical protein n=1 Tax=unclassified Cupriavidus TaxID=2640874 RepID=UPI003F91F626